VGSPPCLRVYNDNISTLKINIIKTYSYLYAVYSRNILVPEGLVSVCLCMGLVRVLNMVVGGFGKLGTRIPSLNLELQPFLW